MTRISLLLSVVLLGLAGTARGQAPRGYLGTNSMAIGQPAGALPTSPRRRSGELASMASPERAIPLSPGELELTDLKQRISQAFDRILKHPRTLVVRLKPAVGRPLRDGRFDRIDLGFEGGTLDFLDLSCGQVRLKAVDLDVARLVEFGDLVFESAPEPEMRLEVHQNTLNALLSSRQAQLKIKDPRLQCQEVGITFTGRMKIFLMENSLTLRGQPAVADGKLVFRPESLHVGVLPLPQHVVADLAARTNPIFDLGQLGRPLGVAVLLTSVEVHEELLVLATAGARGWRPH